MAFKRWERMCNQSGASKILYLSSATLATSSFIIGCILIHLVVVPYRAERFFVPTTCYYYRSDAATFPRNCENKCSKENSKFPCFWLKVQYATVEGETRVANLYDYYRTYASWKRDECASSPCNKRPEDNVKWIKSFNQSLYDKKNFDCFYNENNHGDVLLHKLHPWTLMFHSVLWPSIICIVSIIVCFCTWCLAGCSGWSQEMLT